MRLLIGLLSGWNYKERRRLCRRTWIPLVEGLGHRVVFLMGVPSITAPTLEGDLLLLPTPDDYPTLPQRSRQFFKWAMTEPGWDFTLKADDDSFFAARRLHNFVQTLQHDYTGFEFHSQMSYHSGGAGYLCSRRAVQILAEKMTPPVGAEDQIAGTILNAHHMPTYYRPDMMIGTNHDQRRPLKGNQFIAAHGRWLDEAKWMESFEQTKGE